jgi:hypothetical protein
MINTCLLVGTYRGMKVLTYTLALRLIVLRVLSVVRSMAVHFLVESFQLLLGIVCLQSAQKLQRA